MILRKLNLLITLLAISIGANAQTNYYISPSGSNSNNGLLATPWQTIQYGIGQANNGDTLNLLQVLTMKK